SCNTATISLIYTLSLHDALPIYPLDAIQNVDGIIAIGKYSTNEIQQLDNLNANLIFVDSDSLSNGFSCVVTDFQNSVITINKDRSEEHTSELQSRFDLVCRLLLE